MSSLARPLSLILALHCDLAHAAVADVLKEVGRRRRRNRRWSGTNMDIRMFPCETLMGDVVLPSIVRERERECVRWRERLCVKEREGEREREREERERERVCESWRKRVFTQCSHPASAG